VAVVAACDGATTPRVPNLRIIISTAGVDLDPDGYLLSAGGLVQALPVYPSITQYRFMDAGTHRVTLADLAPNCTATSPTEVQVEIREEEIAVVGYTVECRAITGVMAVMTTTTGRDLPFIYTATVTPTGTISNFVADLAVNGTTHIPRLPPGNYAIGLSGFGQNCRVLGEATVTAAVSLGGLAYDTTTVAFTIECTATTGDIRLVTASSGSTLDPDGYTMWFDGVAETLSYWYYYGEPSVLARIPANGEWVFSGRAPGNHTIEIRDVAPNCVIAGGNPRTVTVTVGAVTDVRYEVACAP
jgi:hypothetical protein